jgi:hypothetical protein
VRDAFFPIINPHFDLPFQFSRPVIPSQPFNFFPNSRHFDMFRVVVSFVFVHFVATDVKIVVSEVFGHLYFSQDGVYAKLPTLSHVHPSNHQTIYPLPTGKRHIERESEQRFTALITRKKTLKDSVHEGFALITHSMNFVCLSTLHVRPSVRLSLSTSVDQDVSHVPDAVMNVIFDRLSPHEIRRIERKNRKTRCFANDMIWKKKCHQHLRPGEMDAAGGEHKTWRSLFSSVRRARHRTEAKWLEEAKMVSSEKKKRRSKIHIVPIDEEKERIAVGMVRDQLRIHDAADVEDQRREESASNGSDGMCRKKRKQTECGSPHERDVNKSVDGRIVVRTHTYRVGKTLYSEVSVEEKEESSVVVNYGSKEKEKEKEKEKDDDEEGDDDGGDDGDELHREDAMICCAFDEFDEDYHEKYFDYGE